MDPSSIPGPVRERLENAIARVRPPKQDNPRRILPLAAYFYNQMEMLTRIFEEGDRTPTPPRAPPVTPK